MEGLAETYGKGESNTIKHYYSGTANKSTKKRKKKCKKGKKLTK